MQKPSSKKPIIIGVIVLVLAGIAYFYFSGTPKDTTSLLTPVGTESDAAIEGANVLALLNTITRLKIDPTVFKSPLYMSLVDHTVIVPEQNVGKQNPFAATFGR